MSIKPFYTFPELMEYGRQFIPTVYTGAGVSTVDTQYNLYRSIPHKRI